MVKSFLISGVLLLVMIPGNCNQSTIANFKGFKSEESIHLKTVVPCHFFLLEKNTDDFSLSKVYISEGAQEEYTSNIASGILDIVAPVGVGGSGNLASYNQDLQLKVSCLNNELHIIKINSEGEKNDWPVLPMKELIKLDIRVSITGGDGTREAFLISRYDHVQTDDIGPVKNPFGNKIPLGKNDYIIFTESILNRPGSPVSGSAPLEYDKHLYVSYHLRQSSGTRLILDIGASSSVFKKSALPADIVVNEAQMVEYSSKGKRILKYAPSGATGTVSNVLGTATIDHLTVGDIEVTDITVDVLESFPDWIPQDVGGILGLDVLRRANVISIDFENAGRGNVILGEHNKLDNSKSSYVTEVPFSYSTAIFIKGNIDNLALNLILDTGAPTSILHNVVADSLHWSPPDNKRKSMAGLDEKGIDYWTRTTEITIGENTYDDELCRISNLPVLSSISENKQFSGILGNSFFTRFDMIQINFDERIVYFLE